MIISTDLEKSFNRIQYPFIIKKRKKSPENEQRRNLPQHNKAMNTKPTANIISNGEKLKGFPLRSGTR